MLDFGRIIGKQPFGTVISAYPPETAVPPPFAFVTNISKMASGDALEIAPGYRLRRATDAEIKFAKKMIESQFAPLFGASLWEERRPKSGSGKYVKIPKKQWKYHVIELPDDHEKIELVEKALAVAPSGLEIGFVVSRTAIRNASVPICMYNPPQLFQSLSSLYDAHKSKAESGKVFAEADAAEIMDIFMRLESYDRNILDIDWYFDLLFDLKDLPRSSPLQILGYFAILESVLTHQPNPDDRNDSITRQITQKLALLNKRWKRALDYSGFGSTVHKKIWQEMYAYRSAIAHGAKPDFKSKLQVLKTAKNADELIKQTVKKTISQALAEPQLLADLHEC